MLVTTPIWTGSSPDVNTTGIVEVAVLAACAAGGPPAMITVTLRLSDRRPIQAIGRTDRRPNATQSRHSCLPQSRLPRGLYGMQPPLMLVFVLSRYLQIQPSATFAGRTQRTPTPRPQHRREVQ